MDMKGLRSVAMSFLGVLLLTSQGLYADDSASKGKGKAEAAECEIGGFSAKQCAATATAASHNISVYGQKQAFVAYVNLFRYQFSPQVNSTTIAGATTPGGLAPSVSSAAVSSSNLAPAAVHPPGDISKQPPPQPSDPCDDGKLTAGTDDAKQIAVGACFSALQEKLKVEIGAVATLRNQINASIRSVADEQHCYIVRTRDFAQPILTQQQAKQLVEFAKENGQAKGTLACYQGDAQSWPSADADIHWNNLISIQTILNNLQTSPGFTNWAKAGGDQAAYNSMGTLVTSLITEVTSYATRLSPSSGSNVNIGQAFTDFQNALDSNRVYRDDLSRIANAAAGVSANVENVLIMTIPLNACAEWYGRGRADTITLQYTDVTANQGQGSPPSISLGTNTCMPLSIASTGIGVSFLPSPVYGFVPADNTGAQVIGLTANNDKSPLYAALYNVKLATISRTVEFFASPGVGFTSSSNTTTTDILAGCSFSLARRLLFVTPSADIGRRDELMPGFAIGTPKGSLSTVPTRPHWGAQFMISVSFGIPSS